MASLKATNHFNSECRPIWVNLVGFKAFLLGTKRLFLANYYIGDNVIIEDLKYDHNSSPAHFPECQQTFLGIFRTP